MSVWLLHLALTALLTAMTTWSASSTRKQIKESCEAAKYHASASGAANLKAHCACTMNDHARPDGLPPWQD